MGGYLALGLSSVRHSPRLLSGHACRVMPGVLPFCPGGRAARSHSLHEVKYTVLCFCFPQRRDADTPAIPESLAERAQFPEETGKCALTVVRDSDGCICVVDSVIFLPGATKGAARFLRVVPQRSTALQKSVPPRRVSFTCGLSFLFQPRQVIAPILHHLPALRQILGVIVCRPDAVEFAVGKLSFYPVPVISQLVQER